MPVLPRLLLAAALLACVQFAMAADLVVSAASSLTNAFRDIGRAYEARYPGDRVIFNFAASDVLMRQIVQGAPVDVFASADRLAMDRAIGAGAVRAATRVDFAGNDIAVVVPFDSRLDLRTPHDLAGKSVRRVAYGDPVTTPAGRYARNALQATGLWQAIAAKGVPANDVRQALHYVARGEADAGLVFVTDAASMPDKIRVVAMLSPRTRISYPIAVTTRSRNAVAAARFVAFVRSREAQRILAGHGFRVR